MQYRRAKVSGGTYFFTVVTSDRRPLFQDPEHIAILRQSFRSVRTKHPFIIDAAVILPDHLHCIWTLPEGDANFSTRWRLIKGHFSRHYPRESTEVISLSRQSKQERNVWQRRFWEHCIRDELDLANHLDYIHYNPVKHGWVKAPKDWPYSSFHRYVNQGYYPHSWAAPAHHFEPPIGDRP